MRQPRGRCSGRALASTLLLLLPLTGLLGVGVLTATERHAPTAAHGVVRVHKDTVTRTAVLGHRISPPPPPVLPGHQTFHHRPRPRRIHRRPGLTRDIASLRRQLGLAPLTPLPSSALRLAPRVAAQAATPAGSTIAESFSYDPAGNVTQLVDFNERAHTMSFDGANHLTQQVDTCPTCTYSYPITTSLAYDAVGDVITQMQQQGPLIRQTAARYNVLGWLTDQDDGAGPTHYGYDRAGRVVTQSAFGGAGVITTMPDAGGRITTISDTAPGTSTISATQFTYTLDDRPLTDTLPDGVGIVTDRQYDADSRLTTLATHAPTFQYIKTYGFNAQAMVNAITTTTNSNVPAPEYLYHDAVGRMYATNQPDGTQATYLFDAANNLTQVNQGHPPAAGTPPPLYAVYQYTYTSGVTPTNWQPNELAAATIQNDTTTYGYDNNGGTTDITDTTGLQYSLFYDASGHFMGAERNDSTTAVGIKMEYNARGLRDAYTVIAPNTPATLPLFQEVMTYRGDQVGQVAVTGTTTTPFTETFVYRPDGSPLELLYQSEDGQGQDKPLERYWYVLDGQGSVFALVDGQGMPVDTYSYDDWGAPDVYGTSEKIHQPLRYRGYWYDGWDNSLSTTKDQGWNTGPLPWYWLTTRAYDPELKRFLQPDPSSMDGIRSYTYGHDDPVDESDASGLLGGPDEPGAGGPVVEPGGSAVPPEPVMPASVAPSDGAAAGPGDAGLPQAGDGAPGDSGSASTSPMDAGAATGANAALPDAGSPTQTMRELLRTQAAELRARYPNKLKPWPVNGGVPSGNVAAAEIQLDDGSSPLAQQASSRGTPPLPVAPVPASEEGYFEPSVVDGYLRQYDSEYKVLSALAGDLEGRYGVAGARTVTGRLYLYSERNLCASCADVLRQFQERFPGITVVPPFYDFNN